MLEGFRQTRLAFEIGVAAHAVFVGFHDAAAIFGADAFGADGFFFLWAKEKEQILKFIG